VIHAVRVEAAGSGHLNGVAGAQVEAAFVERTRHHAARQLADAEWRRHVRAAIVGDEDPVVGPGDQQVQIRQRDAAHRSGREISHGHYVHERRRARARRPQLAGHVGEFRDGRGEWRPGSVAGFGSGLGTGFGGRGDRVGQILGRHGVHDGIDRPVFAVLFPVAGQGFVAETGPFGDNLRRHVAGQGPQSQTLNAERLEAPAGDEADGALGVSVASLLGDDPVADGMAARVGAEVQADRTEQPVGGGIHYRELGRGSIVPGLERHQDVAAGVGLGVGHRDQWDPALRFRVLAGSRDGRRVFGPKRPHGHDAIAQLWVGRGQSLEHLGSMPRA